MRSATSMSGAVPLVVCGDAARREGFVLALREAGWQVVLSAGGMSEAAGLLRNAPGACVIIDSELEDMPGLEAARIVRNLCPHLKIIFTTPQNTRDLESQVRALDVFYFHISSADRAELIAAVEDAIGAPRPGRRRQRPEVLIVDDDPDFHDAVRLVLKAGGYETVSTFSQQEGLAIARRDRPDAILLDIIMNSTTDGFEFCRELRRDPRIKHTPIIGVSAIEERMGLGRPPDRDGDLFPVDGYLRKPVASEQLFAELRRLIPAWG